MARITAVSATMMDEPKAPKRAARQPKELTPEQRARERQQRQFAKLVSRLEDPQTVFEVRPGKDEKPLTIRQRLLRAAADQNVEIAVRKSPNGFLVGLMTPERRSNRGRKPGSGRRAAGSDGNAANAG